MKFIWIVFAFVSSGVQAAQATLAVVADDRRLSYTQSQLLSRSDIQTISVPDSVYRRRFSRFKAIPIVNLFRGVSISNLAVVQCNGTDGFSVILAKSRLFSTDPGASRAFLAIEDPRSPWPNLAGKNTSAGPFYLIWKDSQASSIGREEWPFNIASFVILSEPRLAFPNIYPANDAAPAVQNGFKSFQKNCFACHRMNGDGAASIAPDLNLPMNPTEYFNAEVLSAYIRDPASVRTWPGMVMRGFSAEAISDAELTDLIAYLGYMTTRKHKP